MAGTEVGALFYDLNLDDKNLKKQLGEADKNVKTFGDHVSTMGDQMQAGLRQAAKVMAVAGAGLTLFAKNATDFTKDLVLSSKSLGRELGITTTEASRLVAAMGRMGVGTDAAKQMFGLFAKQIVASTAASETNRLATEKLQIQIEQTKRSIADTTAEIKKNGDKSGELSLKLRDLNNTLNLQKDALNQSADGFAKLGISTKDTSGKQKDFNTLLFEVADKFKAMPDGIDKTALSMQLFGRSGKDMIKVLNLGSDGIQELERQADKLGLTLSAQTIGNVAKLIRSQKDLKEQTDALKIAVGTATAPALTKFNTVLNKIIQSGVGAHQPLKSITVDILAFGGPVLGASASLAAFAGNISSIGPKIAKLAIGFGTFGIAIAIIAGGIYLIVNHFGGLQNTLTAMQPVLAYFNNLWTILKNTWDVLWPSVAAVGAAFMQNLLPALLQIRDAVVRLWNALNPGLMIALKVIGAMLAVEIFGAIWLFISVWNILIQAFSIGISIISNLINWIANFIGWIGNAALAVGGAVLAIGGWFSRLPGYAASAASAVLGVFGGMVSGIGKAVGNIASVVGGGIEKAVSKVWSYWGWFVDAGWGLIKALAAGIKDAALLPVHAVEAVFKAVGKLLPGSDAEEGPLSRLTASGRALSETFAKGITSSGGKVVDAIQDSLALPFNTLAANIQANRTVNAGQMGGANSATGDVTNHGDTIVNIGTVQDRADADYILRRIDRNTQLESLGLSPVGG